MFTCMCLQSRGTGYGSFGRKHAYNGYESSGEMHIMVSGSADISLLDLSQCEMEESTIIDGNCQSCVQ